MGLPYKELEYGSYTFTVYRAGGVASMDAYLVLAKGVLPGLEEALVAGRALFGPGGLEAGERLVRDFVVNDSGVAEPQPAMEQVVPLLRALNRALSSLTPKDMAGLRECFLFHGGNEVAAAERGGHAKPGDPALERRKHQLTSKTWDMLFEGDGLGALYVFGLILWFNLGNSSPALAALRKLLPQGKGGTGSSGTSSTFGDGSSVSSTTGSPSGS